MKFDARVLKRIIDISLLRVDVTQKEVAGFSALIKQMRFGCAFVMPCYVKELIEELREYEDIHVGAAIGYPSGAEPPEIKLAQTRNYLQMGADELDLVINIGWLKSGCHSKILDELKAVVAISESKPVKVILEVTLLDEDEIKKGCELVVASGADFVKTGTGFMKSPTTIEHIKTIKQCVGNDIGIKAAGGVQGLDTVMDMLKNGVTRFGMSWRSAVEVVHALEKYPDGINIENGHFDIP